jgi:5,10-methylenetetrahydromethanopterin reductase
LQVTTFGLSLAASVREPISRIADLVGEAERRRFAYAFVIDSQMAFKDVYVTLASCAQRTNSIRLGTGVTNPITRDVTVTASSISAIHELSGGRAVLGLGNGATATEGIGLRGAKLAETREAVRTLRALLDGDEAVHNGLRIRMPGTQGRVPIFLSASRPRMLRLAGEVADGVILMGPANATMLRRQLDPVLDGLARSGRSRNQFHIDIWQTISVSDDKERAIGDVKSWVASQLMYWFARIDELPPEVADLIDRDQLDAAAADYVVSEHLSLHAKHRELVSPELADLMTIAGDNDHAVRRLQEVAALGADNITLTLLSGGREQRLGRLGDVIAEVRSSGLLTPPTF